MRGSFPPVGGIIEPRRNAMKRAQILASLVVLVTLVGTAWAEQPVEEILKAIVKIRAIVPEDARTARALGTEREGSGVVIDARGHILTIGYLIMEAETIEIVGPGGKPISGTFIGYDHSTGFGLLRAKEPLEVLPMKLGQSSGLKEGDPILVASHGGGDAVQGARVVARKEFAGYWEYLLDEAIFTAPAIANFGGAALIGREGQLLGIGSLFTQVVIGGIGAIPCNMFVPIDLLIPILADLISTGRSKEPVKPWLGLNAEESHGRVFVIRVSPGGPAEKAGIQTGDVILTVKGIPVKGLADFYRKVWALGSAGADVPLSVLQGIQIRDLTVHSGDRYDFFGTKPGKPARGTPRAPKDGVFS
jgi:S1-C subfamily serine protease